MKGIKNSYCLYHFVSFVKGFTSWQDISISLLKCLHQNVQLCSKDEPSKNPGRLDKRFHILTSDCPIICLLCTSPFSWPPLSLVLEPLQGPALSGLQPTSHRRNLRTALGRVPDVLSLYWLPYCCGWGSPQRNKHAQLRRGKWKLLQTYLSASLPNPQGRSWDTDDTALWG